MNIKDITGYSAHSDGIYDLKGFANVWQSVLSGNADSKPGSNRPER